MIYSLAIKYPQGWRVEPNPQSTRIKGDVAFKAADFKNSRTYFTLSWRPLKDSQKKYATVEEHAKHIIMRLKKEKHIESISITENKITKINGHKTIVNYIKIHLLSLTSLFKRFQRQNEDIVMFSALLRCKKSERYITIYQRTNEQGIDERKKIFEKVLNSLNCH